MFVRTRDRPAVCRRAEWSMLSGVIRLRQPQQRDRRGAPAKYLFAEPLGCNGVAGFSLGNGETFLGGQRAAAGAEAAGRVVDPAKASGSRKYAAPGDTFEI